MVETETDSIQTPVRKLNSKRVQVVTPKSTVLLQLELIARNYGKGVRPRMIVISKLDDTTKDITTQKEFNPNFTKEMETYLVKLGADNQTKRCMTWIANKTK